jgi:hypothetical protein
MLYSVYWFSIDHIDTVCYVLATAAALATPRAGSEYA